MNEIFRSKSDFAAFSVFIVVSFSLAVLAYSFGGVDFGVYYAAGRVLLQGGNPYDYGQLAGEIISSTGGLNNPYYYAPWFTWAVSLLTFLPYEAARVCWAVINFIFWSLSLFNLSKLIDFHAAGWKRWGMYLFVTTLFAWSTWGSEQVGVLILLLLTAALIAHERGQWLWMGLWMALLLFKPNITAVPTAILSIWLLLQRQWRPVAWMAGILVGMAVVSVIISPGWYLALLQPDKLTGLSYTLNETGEVQVLRYSTTLLDWLATYGVNGVPAYVLYAFVALGGILMIGQVVLKSGSIIRVAAFAWLVNFALIPYALFYDYASLTLTLFFVNAELAKQPALIWLQRAMNTLLFASLLVGDNITYRYWIVVVLIASAVLGRVVLPVEKSPA